MTMPDALSRCLVLNTVAAARTLLRRYDAKLKPHGVTVQQFALLAAIRFHPGEPVAGLALRVSLDRTGLTRSLDLLEGKGLIRRAVSSGNLRVCELTEAGDQLLDRLLSEWQETQSALLASIGEAEAESYLRVSRHLTER